MKALCGYFSALSDVTRLKIVQLLTEHEMCVCELEDRLGMSQPAISHHLGVLKRAGLISGRKSGKWTYYSVNGEQIVENHSRFNEMAYFNIESRVKNGEPATPPQKDENSYCKTRKLKKNRTV
ncbi:MAG: ArsR/SmtB family transcription factor [Bacillota bacterium]